MLPNARRRRRTFTLRLAELKISREEGSWAAKGEKRAAEGLQLIYSAPSLIRLLDKRLENTHSLPGNRDRSRQVAGRLNKKQAKGNLYWWQQEADEGDYFKTITQGARSVDMTAQMLR